MDTVKEVLKDYQQNYKDHFYNSLLGAKGGLIVVFILITLVYQAKYRKIENAQTFFGTPLTRLRIVGGALVAAVLGMLSVIFVIVSRAGTGAIMRNINNILIVGIILFLFAIAQESSGFNRWLARKETKEGHGPYVSITKEKYASNNHEQDYEKELEEEKKCENIKQPFLDSVSTLSLILIGIGLIYFIGRLVLATYYGFTSQKNNLSSLPGMFGGNITPLLGFAIELLIVGALNAASPALDPLIRGEGYDPSKAIMIVAIFIISVSLHIMLQYTGMLKGF
jgi:hypothetical protein